MAQRVSLDFQVHKLTLNSYAKVNLYLEVLKRRKDGYHNLRTLFERISLSDKIILKSRRDKKINITCNAATVPLGNTNLAWRSAKLLQEEFSIDKGVDIKIIKRIPVGSGMGGGSSNAACVLTGLNKLWKMNLSQSRLVRLGRKLGCDVPFFIYNTPFALGEARGDEIRPLRSLVNVRLWHILVVPKIQVSTASIYKKWDGFKKLTMPKYNVNILNLALKKNNLSLIGNCLFNSLEPITARLYPQIKAVKKRLVELGVQSILMSGSGPVVFGIVSSRKEGLSLYRQLKAKRRWRVFLTRTRR